MTAAVHCVTNVGVSNTHICHHRMHAQDLCKRLALDVLGLTGFAYAFNALNGAGEASGKFAEVICCFYVMLSSVSSG